MNKNQFLKSLDKVYVRIGKGRYGVGVIAIRDIPKGIDPFYDDTTAKYLSITPEEVKDQPSEIKKLIKDFCPLQDGKYYVPYHGMNSISVAYYLNHSKKSNMVAVDMADSFKTSRNIKKGEELTVDYETYDDIGL